MRYTVRPISDRTVFTGKHRRSSFQSNWTATERLLGQEVQQLKGRDLVLEMDVTERDIRIDGQVRANARPASPAVRIAFDSEHGPLTYGTDAFTTWQDNVRAIALGLEALRKVDRYGIAKRGEQYVGWKALPAGRAMSASHMTRDDALAVFADVIGRAPTPTELADADEMRAMHRSVRAMSHPDRHGGDQTMWDQVEIAAVVLGVAR